MSNVDFETISPLISKQEVEGSTLVVTFTCPQTSQTVQARGQLQAGKGVGSMAKRSALQSVGWSIGSAVRRAMGHNIAGRVAGDVSRGVANSAVRSQQFGKKEKQAAAVLAFQSVASQFAWDEAENRWVHTTALEP